MIVTCRLTFQRTDKPQRTLQQIMKEMYLVGENRGGAKCVFAACTTIAVALTSVIIATR